MVRRLRNLLLLPLLTVGLAACDDDITAPTSDLFIATLNGVQEVPSRLTPATGEARFVVWTNNTIDFELDVTDIENVYAAHIHGPAVAGENSPAIVTLFYDPAIPSGPFSGRLAEGTITGTDDSQDVAMEELIEFIRTGQAYVNVHTNDGIDPLDTGDGDFNEGEIRGQIVPDV